MRNTMLRNMPTAVAKSVTVPEYIKACASAVRYDLLHGPAYCRVPAAGIEHFTEDDFATFPEDLEDELKTGDKIENCYCGEPGDALRAFLDDMPSSLYYDVQSDDILTSEPEGFEDEETGAYVEPEWSDYYHLEARDIVEALFGKVIAEDFR